MTDTKDAAGIALVFVLLRDKAAFIEALFLATILNSLAVIDMATHKLL